MLSIIYKFTNGMNKFSQILIDIVAMREGWVCVCVCEYGHFWFVERASDESFLAA